MRPFLLAVLATDQRGYIQVPQNNGKNIIKEMGTHKYSNGHPMDTQKTCFR